MKKYLIADIFVENNMEHTPITEADELRFDLFCLEHDSVLSELYIGEAIVDEIMTTMVEGDVYVDKALSIGLGFPITEGVKDSIKNGYDKVIAFIKEILRKIKTYVLKAVDFVFGTDYAVDYNKVREEVKEVIKEDEEFKATLLESTYGKLASLGKEGYTKSMAKIDEVVKSLSKEENESDEVKRAVKAIEGVKPTIIEDSNVKKDYMVGVKGVLNGLSTGVKGLFANIVEGQKSKSMASIINDINAHKSVSQSELVKLAKDKSKYFEVAPNIPGNAKILNIAVSNDGLDIKYVTNNAQGKPKISKVTRRVNPNLTAKELSSLYATLNNAISAAMKIKTVDDIIDKNVVSDKDMKLIKDYVKANGDIDSALEKAVKEAAAKGTPKAEIDVLVDFYKFEAEATMKLMLKTAKRGAEERRVKMKGMKKSLGKDRKGRVGNLDFKVTTRTFRAGDGVVTNGNYDIVKAIKTGKDKATVANLPDMSGTVYLSVKGHVLYAVKLSHGEGVLKALKKVDVSSNGERVHENVDATGKTSLDGTKLFYARVDVKKTTLEDSNSNKKKIAKIKQITDLPDNAKIFYTKTDVPNLFKSNVNPTNIS